MKFVLVAHCGPQHGWVTRCKSLTTQAMRQRLWCPTSCTVIVIHTACYWKLCPRQFWWGMRWGTSPPSSDDSSVFVKVCVCAVVCTERLQTDSEAEWKMCEWERKWMTGKWEYVRWLPTPALITFLLQRVCVRQVLQVALSWHCVDTEPLEWLNKQMWITNTHKLTHRSQKGENRNYEDEDAWNWVWHVWKMSINISFLSSNKVSPRQWIYVWL